MLYDIVIGSPTCPLNHPWIKGGCEMMNSYVFVIQKAHVTKIREKIIKNYNLSISLEITITLGSIEGFFLNQALFSRKKVIKSVNFLFQVFSV